MALASGLRSIASQLIRQYGEACLLVRTVTTPNAATGTPTTATTTYSFRAVAAKTQRSTTNDPTRAVLRQFSGGGRVLQGDEQWLVAALDVAVEPQPTDTFYVGATATDAGRRRIMDFEAYKVEGSNVAFMLGASR